MVPASYHNDPEEAQRPRESHLMARFRARAAG